VSGAAQNCALPLPLFCNRDLEIKPMTLKLEGGIDVLKLYVHTEYDAVSLRRSKLRVWIGQMQKHIKICLKVKGQG